MNFTVFFLVFALTSSFANALTDSKNRLTRYKDKTPIGVCFETSLDKYLIKKKHTVSDLMSYFKLRPLFCEKCSVETAQTINSLEDVDTILPGQILIIPKKCANFSWQETFNYKKIPDYKDQDIDDILQKRESENTTPAVSTNSEISNITKIKNKKTEIAYNKLGVEPFGIYSELIGASSVIEARLITNLGQGLKVYYQNNITTTYEALFSISAYRTEIVADKNSTTLVEKEQTPISTQAGLRQHFNDDWSLTGLLSINQDLFFEQTATNEVTVKKAINSSLKVSPEFTFLRYEKLTLALNAGLALLMPTSVAGSATKIGTLYDAEFKVLHKLDYGRVYAGLAYDSRQQKNDTYDFKENSLTYKIGTYYLF
ncbi:MAG: hypothetical protein ABL930_08915 [Pseudobdellovibrio sp.]